jgi:hypothetical protein
MEGELEARSWKTDLGQWGGIHWGMGAWREEGKGVDED